MQHAEKEIIREERGLGRGGQRGHGSSADMRGEEWEWVGGPLSAPEGTTAIGSPLPGSQRGPGLCRDHHLVQSMKAQGVYRTLGLCQPELPDPHFSTHWGS